MRISLSVVAGGCFVSLLHVAPAVAQTISVNNPNPQNWTYAGVKGSGATYDCISASCDKFSSVSFLALSIQTDSKIARSARQTPLRVRGFPAGVTEMTHVIPRGPRFYTRVMVIVTPTGMFRLSSAALNRRHLVANMNSFVNALTIQ